jgi:uncharacterized protein
MTALRLLSAVLTGLAMIATACSAPAGGSAPDCFRSMGSVLLPDREQVLSSISHGEAGREIAEAVMTGDRDRAVRLVQADPGLLSAHVPKVEYPDFAPDGQFGDLLTFAVARCDVEMIDALLAAGLPPDGHHAGEDRRKRQGHHGRGSTSGQKGEEAGGRADRP